MGCSIAATAHESDKAVRNAAVAAMEMTYVMLRFPPTVIINYKRMHKKCASSTTQLKATREKAMMKAQ